MMITNFSEFSGEVYRAVFVAALNKWADSTCIQFHLATASWQDHIEFIQSEHRGYVQSRYFADQSLYPQKIPVVHFKHAHTVGYCAVHM